jgi:hypothetical protein
MRRIFTIDLFAFDYDDGGEAVHGQVKRFVAPVAGLATPSLDAAPLGRQLGEHGIRQAAIQVMLARSRFVARQARAARRRAAQHAAASSNRTAAIS